MGREAELAVLQAAFDAAAAGRPTIVLLVGEAGIGKTRLTDEAAALARASGIRVLRGEADAAIRRPMELWRGVYRSLDVVPANDPALPAEERRWEQLESLTAALAAAAPAVVVLDDLHWADAVAVWVLEHLPRALGDAPVAFVATSRDQEPGMPRLDAVRRVSRLVHLEGLDVDAVRRMAAALTTGPVDAVELRARTGGNPLFVRELLIAPDGGGVIGGVIGEVLDRVLRRFDVTTRELLATAALAGPGAPLAVLAAAASTTAATVADRLAPAVLEGVLDGVSRTGVRFHHALLADAAARLVDARSLHGRLAVAWEATGGLDGRASAGEHRLRAAVGPSEVARAVATACDLAAELIAAGHQARAAGLLQDAREAAVECIDRPDLRARVSLDLATILRRLGDLDLALEHYGEAAELARGSADPLLRARAAVGANLWVTAFIPDPGRLRRLEDALAALPDGELRLRAAVLGRLAVVGGADLDAADRARDWAEEAVDAARRTGDPVLVAQALINLTMSPASRDELDARLTTADEVVHLAERAGRSDLALYGHQRRFCHHLNHGDVGAAHHALERAELLAGLLPSPGWRQRTLVQRTTLHALTTGRAAATASMDEAVRAGSGHIEPLVLLGCELLHRIMLLELYGGTEPRAGELYRTVVQMIDKVPSPLLQVQKGFVAQHVGDEARVHDVLHRYAGQPGRVQRSISGDQLLRMLGDMIARAGATDLVAPVYQALLPYAGLLNVGGGQCAGLPVDDVLGRLAALAGDVPAAVRHARDAVALARALPSPPMLVGCLDHLADAVARAGDDDPRHLRAEAAALAVAAGVERPGRDRPPPVPDAASRAAALRRDGPSWVLATPLGSARLPDSTGLGQLARLLRTPGVEVAAVELAGLPGAPPTDLGPALDAQAKRAYRRRLQELQAEIEDAAACNDPVRGERAHVETEALLRELRRAVGLGGRDRPSGSDAERARVNVVRSLRRAIAAVGQQAPTLGAHLEVSVRTGRYCGYRPEPAAALSWTVEV
ncbi:AAA family ATPase [Pseudonocardia sp.]|uniref:AAA family ATPase n=1 Tax=Pseudonocardia sp. TaxID=60912 RepID=UPI003D1323D7